MTRILAVLLVALSANCKGETKYVDDPDKVQQLETYRNLAAEKQRYIIKLEGKLATAREKCGVEWQPEIDISGCPLQIQGRGPYRVAAPKDPTATAKDTQLYKAFAKKVTGTKGSIRKCYSNALKKDSSLQASTINLKISIKYYANGKIQKPTFEPFVSKAFASCMTAVARGWKMPATSQSFTFKAQVDLEPMK